MRIRPKVQVQLFQVITITIFWILCGAFLALYKCVTYDILSEKFIFMVPQKLNLGLFLLINLIGPTIGGLIGGSVLILILNERLKRRSYIVFLATNILFFLIFISSLNILVSYIFYYRDALSNEGQSIQDWIYLLLFDPYAIRNIITWLIIAFLTLHGLKIYEKYGPGTLFSMFLGRYHRPHEMNRIFMFLDMTDSTAIAEKLGHLHFFALLHDFYFDITDPILNSRGEIYQYVGDEIVISWPIKKNIINNAYFIACFFSIKSALNKLDKKYNKNYGLLPDFKAAIHVGKVVVGEMGLIKREIVYSGDTLNTTSRMMELCKVYGQKLIISQDIVDIVPDEVMKKYVLHPLGKMSLRQIYD